MSEWIPVTEQLPEEGTAVNITWENYPDDPYLGWYYAEGEQYVVRDAMLDTFFFVRARSPKEAYEKFVKRLNEAFNAGKWVDEDETY